MQTQLSTAEIPYVYCEFAELIGAEHWHKRVKKIKDEIRGFPFLKEHLTDENEIVFQLDGLRTLQQRYGVWGRWHELGEQFYAAAALAAQVVSISKRLDASMRNALVRRVHGALKNPDDMRGMRLELSIATHFARSCQEIVWPEMEAKSETFDLLLPGMGQEGLEIECKSISRDKGSVITTREALVFFHHVSRQLQPMIKTLRAGIGIAVTVPDRLPAAHHDLASLAVDVAWQVRAAQSTVLPSGAQIRLVDFDASRLADLKDGMLESTARSVMEDVTGTTNRHAMAIGGNTGGSFVVAVQSSRDDTLFQATFNVLGDAARRQLTGRRAGVLIAGLHGLGPDQLMSVAGQDHTPGEPPTALAWNVSDFLSSSCLSLIHI